MSDNTSQWSAPVVWGGGEMPVDESTLVIWICRAKHVEHGPVMAGDLCWHHEGDDMDIIAYRHQITDQAATDNTETEGEREAWEKIERDQHNYQQLQKLCIEQAHELNKLRSQVRRMREISKE